MNTLTPVKSVSNDNFATAPASAVRWMGMVEGIMLIGGLYAVERFGLIDFSAWPVHPFLFVTALFAAKYGALGGIAAAAASTAAAMMAGALPSRFIGESYLDYLIAVWSVPTIWFALALLLGVVSDGHLRQRAKAEQDLSALRRERDLIASQYDALSTRARRLERIAAGFEPASRSVS